MVRIRFTLASAPERGRKESEGLVLFVTYCSTAGTSENPHTEVRRIPIPVTRATGSIAENASCCSAWLRRVTSALVLDKGKPVARRGRKAHGPLSGGGGGRAAEGSWLCPKGP
jgi:hypothetical protein